MSVMLQYLVCYEIMFFFDFFLELGVLRCKMVLSVIGFSTEFMFKNFRFFNNFFNKNNTHFYRGGNGGLAYESMLGNGQLIF